MIMQALAKYLLEKRLYLPLGDWTTQGFGFLRLRIGPNMRMHVWDSRLRQPEVSDIHDHTQWAFTSYIISGQLVNIRYDLYKGDGAIPDRALALNAGIIRTGIGGGMDDQTPEVVYLIPRQPELYLPVSSYHQEPDEIHRTLPADGIVTIIKQTRRDNESARVFWPVGSVWGNAIPRQCTREEVDQVGGFALACMGDS